jgi:hypothetical protein
MSTRPARCRVCGSAEPEETMKRIAGRWGLMAFECLDTHGCACRLRDSLKPERQGPTEAEMELTKRQIRMERGQGC